MPVRVPPMVPMGIDLPGFFRSPDSPTPAVIPVKAGKTMAKTTKNSWGFRNSMLLTGYSARALGVGFPRKNISRLNTIIPPTR